jgi:hypothetical protein
VTRGGCGVATAGREERGRREAGGRKEGGRSSQAGRR